MSVCFGLHVRLLSHNAIDGGRQYNPGGCVIHSGGCVNCWSKRIAEVYQKQPGNIHREETVREYKENEELRALQKLCEN